MNPEIKAKWVAALRSGKYKQGTRQLRSKSNRFCCWGVLCNLHAEAHPEIAAQQTDPTHYMGWKGGPDLAVQDWAGLKADAGVLVKLPGKAPEYYTLMSCNDSLQLDFPEIATLIEVQL